MDQKMNKIPVAVLGATGAVGQRFVQLLAAHPWFQLTALAASERSSHKRYADACGWHLNEPMPDSIREMQVVPVEPNLEARIIFSALPVEMARQVEPLFAKAGYAVCSNTSAFRLDPNVPVIIPEVNADHLALLKTTERSIRMGWTADHQPELHYYRNCHSLETDRYGFRVEEDNRSQYAGCFRRGLSGTFLSGYPG